MARHSRSTCLVDGPGLRWVLLVVGLSMLLAACANNDGRPLLDRWPEDERGGAASYLQSLREYLALSPSQREMKREQLQESAEEGGRAERLEYAFVLSTALNDTEALEQAREHFESLLAAPEPLPVPLDGLVRLQLAAAIGRLDSLRRTEELQRTAAECGRSQQQCQATVMALSEELEARDEDLDSLQRKLQALTRIEQTVNNGQDEADDDDGDNRRENDNESAPPDSSGRR